MNKKTIFFTSRGIIEMKDGEPVGVNSDREAISNVVLIDEPTHIVYNKGEQRVELDAEEGDIVICFYEYAYPNRILVVNSKEWAENISAYRKSEQETKEKWAAQQANKGDISCDAIAA